MAPTGDRAQQARAEPPARLVEEIHCRLKQLQQQERVAVSAGGAASATALVAAASVHTDLAAPQGLAWLHEAAEALEALPCSGGSPPPAALAAAAGATALLAGQLLLEPPAWLFGGLGGAPRAPPPEMEAAGTLHHEALEAELRVLRLLLGWVGDVELQPADESPQPHERSGSSRGGGGRGEGRPAPVFGIVEIVEEQQQQQQAHNAAEQQAKAQAQQTATQALLVAALYAVAAHLSRDEEQPTAPAPAPADLDAHAEAVQRQGLELPSPWSCPGCEQECELLLQLLGARVTPPGGRRAPATASAKTGAAWPWLLGPLLPRLLDGLRDTLLAQHRHRKAQERGELGAYLGPGTFQRCLAARQLAWLVQSLPAGELAEQLGLLLPLVLATADDPSPSVQRYAHAALGSLALRCPASALRWQGPLLLEEAQRLVVGCEESCWPSAMPAATSLVVALEGRHVRAGGLHRLLLELLTEAERNAHKPPLRLVFMGCLARLVPCVGLYVVRHLGQLMPLLLEWAHSYDEASAVVALQSLRRVLQHAWPRAGAHAAAVWRHMVEVATAADGRQWMDRGGGGEARAARAAHSVARELRLLAELLAACGGEGYAATVAASRRQAQAAGRPAGSSVAALLRAA